MRPASSQPAGNQAPISGVKTVVVFRALNLGDMLCAVPALRALRRGLPGAEISLLGLPWAFRFASRYASYIDRFQEFPGHPGLPERRCSPDRLNSFLMRARADPPDLAVQMHGSGRISNSIIASLGARQCAGFYPAEQESPGSSLFLPYPESLPEVERNLLLVRHLGIQADDPRLEFPVLPGDADELFKFPELRALRPGEYVCVHPGASTREKCWPVEHFASVGRLLREQGLTAVVTGNASESDLAAEFCRQLGRGCIDAASLNLGLGSLALLIRNARLLLCNDTGVSHLASALRVPSVVIFSSADPGRWAPRDRNLHRVLGRPGARPTVREVADEVKTLLTRSLI